MSQIEKGLCDLLDTIEKMSDDATIGDLRSKTQFIYTRNKMKITRNKRRANEKIPLSKL